MDNIFSVSATRPDQHIVPILVPTYVYANHPSSPVVAGLWLVNSQHSL